MPTITAWEGMPVDFPEGTNRREVIARIMRATDDLGFVAFRERRGRLHAAEVVGTLQVGGMRLNILPKNDAVCEKKGSGFLLNLLAAGGYVKNAHLGDAVVSAHSADPMELVTISIARRIQQTLASNAPLRYEAVAENLSTVRGKLEVGKLASCSAQGRVVIPVRHFPLTMDSELARCIKGIATVLLSSARSQLSRNLLSSILISLSATRSISLNPARLESLRLTGAEECWREIIEFGQMFLKGNSPDPTFAGDTNAFGLLFPPHHLFERAMREIIRRASSMLQLSSSHIGGSKFLYKKLENDVGVVRLRPDYLLKEGEAPVAIADAKWKRLSNGRKGLGVSREDLFQIAAYLSRYDVQQGLLLFPKSPGSAAGILARYYNPSGSDRISLLSVDIERLVSHRSGVRTLALAQFAEDLRDAICHERDSAI
ncbi:TPA: hypothetical protein UOA93_002675 [Stenotrophomonas maltophilia]|nr:hypothetical protein [Stenotrophomonas maltophilia]